MVRLARREPDSELRVEMTPMIDVTFLLLVFFLCTLRFKSLEGKLATHLPKDVGVSAEPVESLQGIDVSLRVVEAGERRDARDTARPWDGDGRYRFVGRTLSFRVGPRVFASAQQAAERVRALRDAAPERRLEVDIGPGAIQADVILLLDELRAVGVADVTLTAPPR